MKRDDRKKVKANADQTHPDPHDHVAEHNQCHIDGSVYVRGEIETKFPPDLIKKHNTDREEYSARDKKRFVVEVATLIVVAVYAALTFWLACEATRANIQTGKIFTAESRPWLDFAPESDVDPLNDYRVLVRMKNTGKTPATHVTDVDGRTRAVTEKEIKDGFWDKWEKEQIPMGKNPTDIVSVNDSKSFYTKQDGPYVPFPMVYQAIIVYGRVDYAGALAESEHYWTEFCFAFTPQKQNPLSKPWSTCISHNVMK